MAHKDKGMTGVLSVDLLFYKIVILHHLYHM